MSTASSLTRPKSKKEVVSEFRRSEIITAARKVFAEKGYVAATVEEIAARARLAKGTIYVYFDSKEQIYNAVLDDDREALRNLTLERLAAAPTALEKIATYINTRFAYCEERRDFFRIMYTEPSGVPGSCKDKRYEWLREPVHQLTLALKAAIAKKEIRNWPPETLAWTVADLTTEALQRRLMSTPTTTARQDADFLVEFIYAALQPVHR